ncbi:hypothetical protein [Oleiharenicola lentus]|uniref:hypothetical protein n=1 Tax=Oleiharenicola lentus TaxID=2508720 RepID=UPI003F6759F2
MALLQLSRKKKRKPKWLPALKLLVVAGILFAGWKSIGPLKHQYRTWKQQRALAQAKTFIEKNDPQNAQIALELALTTVPNSVDAWRLAAEMLEQVGAPQAMRLRRRVVDMQPNSVEDRAALILSALKFKDMNAARDAISDMTVEQGSQLPALRAQLAYALATDNAPIADAIFDQIKKLTPDDTELKISQLVLSLRAPRAERVEAARQQLVALAENPKYRLRIKRELMNEALLRKNFAAARAFASEIAADPESKLGDRLNQANIALLVDQRPFEEVYEATVKSVGTSETDALEWTQWLLAQGKVSEADRWIAGLPEESRKAAALITVQADIAAALKQWERLAPLLEAGAWGPVKAETVSLAMSANVSPVRENKTLRAQVWDEAVRSTNASLGSLRVLQKLASGWGWEEESERTLWVTLRSYPDQTWIHQLLFNTYRSRKDADSMRNVMSLLREAEPTVSRYQHDWALLSLLTDPTLAWTPPKETLKKLAADSPANPNFAVSYAFALARSGRGTEAAAVLEKVSAEELARPVRAPYLAYIYAAGGQAAKIGALEEATKGVDLLKEESRLFAAARELAANPKPSTTTAETIPSKK